MSTLATGKSSWCRAPDLGLRVKVGLGGQHAGTAPWAWTQTRKDDDLRGTVRRPEEGWCRASSDMKRSLSNCVNSAGPPHSNP